MKRAAPRLAMERNGMAAPAYAVLAMARLVVALKDTEASCRLHECK